MGLVLDEMKAATYANWGFQDQEAQVEAWVLQLKRLPSFVHLAELCLGLRVVATGLACLNIQSEVNADKETDIANDEAAEKEPEVAATNDVAETGPESLAAPSKKGKELAAMPVASTSQVQPDPLQEQGLV